MLGTSSTKPVRYSVLTFMAARCLSLCHVQACGGIYSIDEDQLQSEDRASLMSEVIAAENQSSKEYPLKRIKKFGGRLVEFLQRFVNEIRHDILYDEELMDTLLNWLSSLSSCTIRSYRHTGTVAANAIAAALIKVATELHSSKETRETQLQTVLKDASSATQRNKQAAKRQVDEVSDHHTVKCSVFHNIRC